MCKNKYNYLSTTSDDYKRLLNKLNCISTTYGNLIRYNILNNILLFLVFDMYITNDYTTSRRNTDQCVQSCG